jgi:hypothetical protein
MKYTVIVFLFTLMFAQLPAQQGGVIEIRKGFWGTTYWKDNNNISKLQFTSMLKQNPAAFTELKKARTNSAFSTLFSSAGGFLIGWPVGTAAGGGDANWAMAGVGAGLVLVAIPFEIAFNKRMKNAVNTYNNGLAKSSWRKPRLSMGFTQHGMGMKMSF